MNHDIITKVKMPLIGLSRIKQNEAKIQTIHGYNHIVCVPVKAVRQQLNLSASLILSRKTNTGLRGSIKGK